jgi:RNA polymerase sigma-70 factor, ECF subfamily
LGTFHDPWRPNIKVSANLDEPRLIADSLKGHQEAFGELVRHYQDRLYNLAYRMVDNTEDAQDIVQDAFLSAYQSLGKFKGRSQFFTWLYRIAVNTAISHKRKRRAVLASRADRLETAAFEPADESEYSRPEHELERTERETRVQDALNRLSPEHRAVLILKDMEGQHYEIMAQVLGVPIGTVRSRLHRARMELRQILARDEEP